MITLFSPEHPLPRGEELRGSVRKLRTEERRADVLARRASHTLDQSHQQEQTPPD